MPHQGIKNLNKKEQPREKLIEHGAAYLTNEELLALIIDSGTNKKNSLELAREILKGEKDFSRVYNMSSQELTRYKGIGPAKATKICAAMEISQRIKTPEQNPIIKNAKDVVKYIKKNLYNKKKEYLYLISTDIKNRVITKNLLSIGTISEALVSPREIFSTALSNNATGIVLVHNHPSDDSRASTDDIEITNKVFNGCLLLGLTFLDHVIYCDSSYFSIRENNLLRKEVKK